MSPLPTPALSLGLIAGGALAWASVARPLTSNPDLATPLNPLGINRSPYGEVIAMAMQGPIDFYFHSGEEHHHGPDEACGPDCGHDHDHDHDHNHDHVHGPDCDHADEEAPAPAALASLPLRRRLTNFISGLDEATTVRTNPKPASPALKFYLRRQTEDKLRFAYNLDPAHYGNFASYYFFLTQPMLGTRPELTSSAVKLAQDTITYCLQREDDPRPALTAAAAVENILEQLIDERREDEGKVPLAHLRQNLALLDHCLARHQEISSIWEATGNWELLSSYRRDEVRDRLHFLNKIRETQVGILRDLEQQAASRQVAR
jgi:hypothetical protein